MKGWRAGWCLRSRDTVTRWIPLTTILAMLTSLGFYALFTQVASLLLPHCLKWVGKVLALNR